MKQFFAVCICLLLIISCASSPKAQPNWVTDPYAKYNKQTDIAAVGSGSNRQAAEKSAFGNLVAFFGQSVQVDESVYTSYQETIRKGVSEGWTENTSVNNQIATSASMDALIGAEIGDVWNDGKGTFYAVAVMNKTKATSIYSQLIDSNQKLINNLLNIPANQKNSLDGVVRLRSAAAIADVNQSYASLLSVIGFSSFQATLKKGDDYRLEARNIAQSIPISVRVKNDRQNRIQGAFNKILAELGFRSGGANPRYTLDVDIAITSADTPGSQHIFRRMELKADLIDNNTRQVLFTYNFIERDGHTTADAAENRVFATAESKIASEYKALLEEYLSK